jgi:hypothetical protein
VVLVICSDSEVKFDEGTVALGGNSDASKSQDGIWSRPHHSWNSCSVDHFIGGFSGLTIQLAHHVNKNSTPVTIFMLFLWM